MPVFMVHKNRAGACFVKDLDFFESQGGNTKPWGKAWHRVLANDIEDARRICKETIDPYEEVATPYAKPAVEGYAPKPDMPATSAGASVQAGPEQKWVYCFGLYPNETWGRVDLGDTHPKIPSAVFDFFHGDGMVERVMTSWEWLTYRNELESFGLLPREVTRWPYHEPETIP